MEQENGTHPSAAHPALKTLLIAVLGAAVAIGGWYLTLQFPNLIIFHVGWTWLITIGMLVAPGLPVQSTTKYAQNTNNFYFAAVSQLGLATVFNTIRVLSPSIGNLFIIASFWTALFLTGMAIWALAAKLEFSRLINFLIVVVIAMLVYVIVWLM